tara:strand:+ start:409 stop:717 length:309 start_codon:yes stop_codon:yes gene_type:complete
VLNSTITELANNIAYIYALLDNVNLSIAVREHEIPTGVKDQVNVEFLLSSTPTPGTEHVYLNGLLQAPETDYIINGAGNKLVFVRAPHAGDDLRVSYRVLEE